MAINKLKQITTRAKSLRKARPGMSWHSAQKAAAAQLRSGKAAPAKKKKKATASRAVAKTHHHKKSKSVGSTTVVVKRKAKKKGFMGASSTTVNRAWEVLQMGGGMAVGAFGTHVILRPLEHKAVQLVKDPQIQGYVAKAMPWAEMFLGGFGAIMLKNKHLRNVSVGVMGAGVHGVVKQLPVHMHSPAETINGVGDYTQVRIPINGTVRDRISGLIQSANGYVQTPTVGASILRGDQAGVHTPTIGGRGNMNVTPVVGEFEDDDEMLFRVNHFAR